MTYVACINVCGLNVHQILISTSRELPDSIKLHFARTKCVDLIEVLLLLEEHMGRYSKEMNPSIKRLNLTIFNHFF